MCRDWSNVATVLFQKHATKLRLDTQRVARQSTAVAGGLWERLRSVQAAESAPVAMERHRAFRPPSSSHTPCQYSRLKIPLRARLAAWRAPTRVAARTVRPSSSTILWINQGRPATSLESALFAG